MFKRYNNTFQYVFKKYCTYSKVPLQNQFVGSQIKFNSAALSACRNVRHNSLLPFQRYLLTAAFKNYIRHQMRYSALGIHSYISMAGFKNFGSSIFNAKLKSNGSNSYVVGWLSICTSWVFALIILGGITRLTRSGLSMTDWKFTGEKPPMNLSDWENEFEKYKRSPEFKKVNKSITLDEFKFIYWMEYAHRMWGRSMGLIFGIPALLFFSKRLIDKKLGIRIGQLFLLGGAQGLIGWWMVKSGLEEPANEWSVPRVSPYRLATHLASAFVIYSILLYTTLSTAFPDSFLKQASEQVVKGSNKLWMRIVPFLGIVSLTAFSGAFVAGLDAGHCYNTFPKMNDHWIPPEYFDIKGIRNFFENSAAVQFNHRLLAITTVLSSTGLYLSSRKLSLLPSTHKFLNAIFYTTLLQVSLGIATLLNHVPTYLASLHQAGALALFSLTLGALHTIRRVRPNNISSRVKPLMANPIASSINIFIK